MGVVEADGAAVEQRFLKKLDAFLVDYDLKERPALLLQAGPLASDIEIDLHDPGTRVALAQGNADDSLSAWHGFQGASSALRGSVDGIAAVSQERPAIWSSELHTDGYLIAGVWDFDGLGVSGRDFLITWKYAYAFIDFGRLVGNVAKAIDRANDDWLITAVLLGSDRVLYGSKANRNSNGTSPPLRRKNLEFRIRRCAGVEGLRRAGVLMGQDFQRAYGESA